jgi:hypothetical protein
MKPLLAMLSLAAVCSAQDLVSGRLRWAASEPLLRAVDHDGDRYHALKDPSIVRYQNRWHVFCTLRGQKRSHQIEYLTFSDWADAGNAQRTTLKVTSGYFCAPEVFYFRPHKKWYLIYQISDRSRTPELQPAWSTTTDISNPASWTPPKLLFADAGKGVKNWIDFWIICDEREAHLFFTSLNGQMHRSDAPLAEFPNGWSQPKVVLQDDIFEASHTYHLKGTGKYLTLVEAQAPAGRRYYKAYLANRLDGAWSPLPTFASPENVTFKGMPWTDSFSHGELLRDGYDETLTVDPAHPVFLFQGLNPKDRAGKNYGEFPWSLGLLRLATP